MGKGKAFIFTAPSGSGKTTIVKHLLEVNPKLGFSISASTRDKRGRSEENGKDYYFLSKEEFRQKIEEDAFVEWEEVYTGNYYGTLKQEVQRIWNEGKHVVFDVEVKGAQNLKRYFGEDALAIFVKVPSMEILKERLTGRGTESAESLSQRFYRAEFEMTFENKFDVTLVNENLEESFKKAEELVNDFLKK
uniref:guanylate kinase n=1 Tax=Roseivirga sp. TaxID=1964215 RepID=UPI004047F1DA